MNTETIVAICLVLDYIGVGHQCSGSFYLLIITNQLVL